MGRRSFWIALSIAVVAAGAGTYWLVETGQLALEPAPPAKAQTATKEQHQQYESPKPFFVYQGMNIVHPPYATNTTWYDMVDPDKIEVPEWEPLESLHPCDFQSSMLKGCIAADSEPLEHSLPTMAMQRSSMIRRVAVTRSLMQRIPTSGLEACPATSGVDSTEEPDPAARRVMLPVGIAFGRFPKRESFLRETGLLIRAK